MGDDYYTRKFGGYRVTSREVLAFDRSNPAATIVDDLTRAESLPSNMFDCIICTQTLQMIFETEVALRHLYRILAPGGVLLATSHGISRIARRENIDPWGEYWHFTSQAFHRLFDKTFPNAKIDIDVYGNVLAAIALLHGLAAEELSATELNHSDLDFEVIIAARALKLPQQPI